MCTLSCSDRQCSVVQAEEMLSRTQDAVERMAHAATSDPHPRLTKYQVEMLKRVMATIQGAPAGSAERHERRVAAVQMCCDIVSRGGCTSVTPYELALRLLEVEEEVTAGCTGGGVNLMLPADTSKGLGGGGGASQADVSMPRSSSIQSANSHASDVHTRNENCVSSEPGV